MTRGYDIYESELIGPIGIIASDKGLQKIILFEDRLDTYLEENPEIKRDKKLCEPIKLQLHEYFIGERKHFNIPLHIEGTSFRKQVWEKLQSIPYGETISYSELAEKIGSPKAVRAVGGANRSNPIPLIVPCHRVIGKNGAMVGFAGAKIDTKVKLIAHEKQYR